MDTLKELAFVFGWVALSLLLVQIFISAGKLSAIKQSRARKARASEASVRAFDK